MEILKKTLLDYFKSDNLIEILKSKKIKDVQMNTELVTEGSIFFAINRGNEFINIALEKGAILVIGDKVSEKIVDTRVISVESTIKTMQEIAELYRKNLNITVIGITGSEGKTTTKDLVYSVLSQQFKCIKTQGNYNNHIGLPFTILNIKDEDEIAVLEMGMSQMGEIDLLSKISKPDYAIITNIGDSHLEYLKNRDNVFKAKTEIFNYVTSEKRVVNGDDFYLKNVEGVKVGFSKENNFVIQNFEESLKGSEFCIADEKYSLNLNGDYNALNSSFAIVLGKMLGMKYEKMKLGLENSKISHMRFEKIQKENILYINDAYNASPVSMIASLKTFSRLSYNSDKIVVLGDMLEMGEKEIEYHQEVLEEALKLGFDEIITFGERMKKAKELLKNENIKSFKDKNEIKKEIEKYNSPVVLLKASRGMKLEEII